MNNPHVCEMYEVNCTLLEKLHILNMYTFMNTCHNKILMEK